MLADEGRARILAMRKPGTDLDEVEELIDPAAHANNADFRRDAYPRRGGGGEMRMGSDAIGSGGEDKLDQEAELFARRIASRLAQAHSAGDFARLRIAAAPRFLGRLRKALDPQIAKTVVDELDKDLLQLSRRELTRKLFTGEPQA
ncbi:MAG TPA: host attachment protein [Albitalea sp.]|nr:host attachment protein [Albitalea sp.]